MEKISRWERRRKKKMVQCPEGPRRKIAGDAINVEADEKKQHLERMHKRMDGLIGCC